MKPLIAIVLVMAALTGCANQNEVKRVLESAGFSHIELKGYSYFGCGEDDVFRTAFVAKGPTGQHVEGVVCGGWFKGSTIRLK